MTKNKSKNYCAQCKCKHESPTGKKCKRQQELQLLSDQRSELSSVNSDSGDSNSEDMQLSKLVKKSVKKQKLGKQKDCISTDQAASASLMAEGTSESNGSTSDQVQMMILSQLQKMKK